jgi:HAD superfamily hydrolase (TIGR01509 family)
MVEAILWDNDGVLVDTESLYFEATKRVLAGAGVELTPELYCDISLRQGRNLLELAGSSGATPGRVLSLREERDALYSRLLQRDARVFPQVTETLRDLHGKIRMAIVTSSKREHFNLIHRASGLIDFFEFAVVREDYAKSKPYPDPYQLALTRLGLSADQCLAIEDSERGLASALAAGVRCVMIRGRFTEESDFRGASAILPDVSRVPDFIRNL